MLRCHHRPRRTAEMSYHRRHSHIAIQMSFQYHHVCFEEMQAQAPHQFVCELSVKTNRH